MTMAKKAKKAKKAKPFRCDAVAVTDLPPRADRVRVRLGSSPFFVEAFGKGGGTTVVLKHAEWRSADSGVPDMHVLHYFHTRFLQDRLPTVRQLLRLLEEELADAFLDKLQDILLPVEGFAPGDVAHSPSDVARVAGRVVTHKSKSRRKS